MCISLILMPPAAVRCGGFRLKSNTIIGGLLPPIRGYHFRSCTPSAAMRGALFGTRLEAEKALERLNHETWLTLKKIK